MKKIKNSKGFTLMEMLIVVAIIAVLIAIAVPTFSASLNKARVATDEANIRSGYASLVAKLLTAENVTNNSKFQLNTDGSVTDAGGTGSYKTLGNASANVQIAGVEVKKWDKDHAVTYTVTIDANGDFTQIDIDAGGTTQTNP